MDRKRVLLISLAPVLLLVLTVGYLYAQGPDPQAGPGGREGGIPQAPLGPQAALGPGFTYQGQLKDSGGNPIDDTCDFSFGLWDAQSAGSQVGSDSVVSGVAVTNGYFTALVNSGGEFGGGAFYGEARWLEISVQCPGDPSLVVLSPRQLLSAAPYALTVRAGAIISGTVAGGNSLTVINNNPTGGAVYGWASATSGSATGVYGVSLSPTGYAGYFAGNVHVFGTLSKTGGSFKIDHPLDPANQYLYHSFVESPDMKNVYDGVVVLDESGAAWVELPAWFETLNRDFRYQLTAIGAPAPDLYIAHKIQDNRFQIAGGTPGLEVSWQVTGIRQDPWAEAHRIPVEQDKPADEQGTYLYPELYGQPEELGLDYQRNQGWEQPAMPEAPPPDAVPE